MKIALCVGIDNYQYCNDLCGCVADACSVKEALSRNEDNTVNFDVQLLTSTNKNNQITRKSLKSNIDDLFKDPSEVALFYFAGHGYIENTGGYLMTSECQEGDDGLPLNELLQIASKSPARNKIIILDSCHSGDAGNIAQFEDFALIKEGMTILTACGPEQYASEQNGCGLFTSLLVDALKGGAMNLLGDVTPGSVYSHIDQSLGPWDQRPLFKTNVRNFVSLRRNIPPISLADLHQLPILFENSSDEFNLDPTYEPQSSCPNKEHCKIFSILQKYNRVNLVVPVEAEHMYYAAMDSKGCKLTPLGLHYRRLVKKNRI